MTEPFSPTEWYLLANRLTTDDLAPGELERINQVEELFEVNRARFDWDPTTTALVVIDMQNYFVHPDSPARCYQATRVLPLIRRLCDECRALDVPVIFTQTHFGKDTDRSFRPIFGDRLAEWLAEGSWGAELCPELGRLPHERVVPAKHTYDSFEGTDLDYVLRSRGIETVIICGTNTDRCCEATARRAFGLQYQVVFGSDVNATDSGMQHLATLRSVRYGFGQVLTAEEIIQHLRVAASSSADDHVDSVVSEAHSEGVS